MDAQLRATLQQTVRVISATTVVDMYGQPTMSTMAEYVARVIGKQELVRNSEGAEVMSDQQFVTEAKINIDDQIWLPGDSTAKNPRQPVAVGERVDEFGSTDHLKVWM